MTMKAPLFSVLLPTYNRLDLLTRAIETVRRQNFEDWEIVVSDNYSHEPIGAFIESLDDQLIKYVRTESFIPVTDNWQNALNHSCGEYVIMLGDDDGLLQNYFAKLSELIVKHDAPEVIYTGALLYAYPNVIPGCTDGFLRSYKNRQIYQNSTLPFLLEKTSAHQLVADSMNFRVNFDYNMQFSLVSRKLIDRLKDKGDFYQTPYPDYYASNVIMLTANDILVVPDPLVIVGISPKSFGYYYFNNAESEGNKFLNNSASANSSEVQSEQLLPGPEMNTSWLYSMERVAQNCQELTSLTPNYERYRLIQICAAFTDLACNKPGAEERLVDVKSLLNEQEIEKYYQKLNQWFEQTSEEEKPKLASKFSSFAASHPPVAMPKIEGKFETILDVFNNIDLTGN